MSHVLNPSVRPNPIACLLAASLAVFLMPGCGSETSETITAESSGLAPADDDAADDVAPANTLIARSSTALDSVAGDEAIDGRSLDDLPQLPIQPPVLADEADPAVIPDGTPAELVEYISKLIQRTPRGRTEEEKRAEFVQIMEARVKAAEKILAGQAEEQYRLAAVQAKLESIGLLMQQLGDETALARFNEFAETVATDENPAIAQMGRLILFGGVVDKMIAGDATEADVLAKLEALLADALPDQFLLEGTVGAATALMRVKKVRAAAQALTLIGNKFKDVEDADMARAGKMMLEQARILPLQSVFSAVLSEQPGTLETFGTMVTALLANEQTGDATITAVFSMAQQIEFSGQPEAAADVYAQVEKSLARVTDPKVVEGIEKSLELAQKRRELLGKPLEVVGQLLDGRPFDWSGYRGKVVLIDFWATWCQPCLAEIPNIQANYDKYREKGFEVVGVNLDDRPQDVESFLARRPLAWPTVVAVDETARGFENPNAVRCGVEAIPFLVLIGTDGNVAALYVRGPKLEEKLAELLGTVETPPATQPDPPATPPAGTLPPIGGSNP